MNRSKKLIDLVESIFTGTGIGPSIPVKISDAKNPIMVHIIRDDGQVIQRVPGTEFMKMVGAGRTEFLKSVVDKYNKSMAAEGTKAVITLKEDKASRLDSATRKKVSHEVSSLSSGKYYDEIPLKDVFNILAKYGIVALQEDNTEWSGFLVGREGTVTLPLAPISSKSSEGFYTPYSNIGLHFSYYKMPSNRYEFIVYVN